MKLAAARADAAVIDELLRDIAHRRVDVSDPDWMAKLRQAPPPVEEAGVAAEAAATLEVLLDAYETGDAPTREEVRDIFRAYPSFRWAAHLPGAVGVGRGVPPSTGSRLSEGSGRRPARRTDDDLGAVQPGSRAWHRR